MNNPAYIIVICPDCKKPLVDKFDSIKIQNTANLLDRACKNCSRKITQEDIFIIDNKVKHEIKKIANKFIVDFKNRRI